MLSNRDDLRYDHIYWIAHIYGSNYPRLSTLTHAKIETELRVRIQVMRNKVIAEKAVAERKHKEDELKQIALLEKLKKDVI